MKIEIKQINDAFLLEAANELGNTLLMDAAPEIGGSNKGMRPMQVLLTSLGGCSSIDVISILKKQKQPLESFHVTVTGEREKDAVPSLFTEAHVHFSLTGNLDSDKVQKAVDLSMQKYCSVAKTLEKTATITYSFEIITK